MRFFKILVFFGFLASILSFCGSGKKLNRVVKDKKTEQKILLGECDREAFKKRHFKAWFEPEYLGYKPERKFLDSLNSLDFSKTKVTIVFATWCSDTRRELPRFYKVADQINIPPKHIRLIATDGKKQSEALGDIKPERVPYFIFYKNEEKAGEIIERPEESMEADIWNILK